MPTKAKQQPITMKELVEEAGNNLIPFKQNEIIPVTVITAGGNRILVDVNGITLGIIPQREFSQDIAEIKPGDKILAYVISPENDEGYVVLSLRRAARERIWKIIEEKHASGEIFPVKIKNANKGGLIIDYGDIEGFLPVSQLSPAHYPKVQAGDRIQILNKLKDFVNQTLKVKIISFDEKSKKLIFSEKAVGDEQAREKAKNLKVGMKMKGQITNVTDFGLFVDLGEGLEGLVHISEIAWEKTNNLKDKFKIGQTVEAEVINLENGRIALSIKKLLPDPWLDKARKLKEGEKIKGKVTKNTPYGSFVALEVGIDGLVHISEISDEEIKDPSEVLAEGEQYTFKILSIEPSTHKINLSYKQAAVGLKKAAKKPVPSKSEKLTSSNSEKAKATKKVLKK